MSTLLGSFAARRGNRGAARRALRDAERVDGPLPEVQLLGQLLPARVYARLYTSTRPALRRTDIRLPDPPSAGGVVMLWALEAGAETTPRPGSPRVPVILGMPLAAMIERGMPYEPAWWLLLRQRLADAPAAPLAVPVLERYSPEGTVQRTVEDFGLHFPLAALDVPAV